MKPERTWDYIVVGAGSAGVVVAARLAAQGDRTVLLLEAGGSDRSANIAIPGRVEQLITSRKFNWQFQGEPDPTLNGRSLTWAAGRVIGGSSSINGMVYGRGLPADYDGWVADGHAGWGWADMLPFFRKLETWEGAPDPARGTDGPVHVRRFDETEAACESAMDALVSAGTPYVEDYAVGITHGVGRTQATQKRGFRHSVARAYLAPRERRRLRNLQIATGFPVDRLIVVRGRCTGVQVRRGNGTNVLLCAEREVIVACGAIGTPKLLMLSGIGAPEELAAHGIAAVHPLSGVGRGLNDHVNVRISAFVDTPTYNTARRGTGLLRHGLDLLARGHGPASSPANHAQAFVKTDPAQASADAQIQLMAFGFGTESEMRDNGITAVISPCRPAVRGAITLRSGNPADPPRIAMAMLEAQADVAILLRASRMAVDALRAGPGQKKYRARIYIPARLPANDADWLSFFRDNAALNWHPTSTCRMGADAGAVVDAQLAVRGLTGLSIADASVMPSVTSANTNVPVIAIAERAAGFILARTA
jgi:choline dehydrogenase